MAPVSMLSDQRPISFSSAKDRFFCGAIVSVGLGVAELPGLTEDAGGRPAVKPGTVATPSSTAANAVVTHLPMAFYLPRKTSY